MARAYAEWYRYPRVTNALYAIAYVPMYVPTYHYDRDEGRVGRAIKNSVDMHLCIDLMKTLYLLDSIATFVLVTGDRDFIPLINAIRQAGKHTVVIGVAQATASHLAQAADEFIFYKQVVDEAESVASGQDPYEALVEVLAAARASGTVTTMATLKLLLLERLPGFDERRLTDGSGRPFARFRDFVREAERRGLAQISASGSITVVLLPGEKPSEATRYPPDTPSEAPRGADVAGGGPPPDEPAPIASFSDTDWAVFEEALRRFQDPVLFIQIYDALRNLRNKAIIDRSNQDLKQMIKLAINSGLLVRTTRGPHAYYHLDPQRPFVAPAADHLAELGRA